ncbi:unnamed protein product [Clavelina lepadiformis]|uniref:Uncharacterized protein n=1 Tax=Clavelina lepadiformis TaxID=159417 RepID=A0ABP0GBP8_CLALP
MSLREQKFICRLAGSIVIGIGRHAVVLEKVEKLGKLRKTSHDAVKAGGEDESRSHNLQLNAAGWKRSIIATELGRYRTAAKRNKDNREKKKRIRLTACVLFSMH